MNLTLTQSFHRTQTLSGELKAAESALADCEADANAKERIASIAAEAVTKAFVHLETLRHEREQLADHMAALVRKTGEPIEPPPLAENGPEDRVECEIAPINVFDTFTTADDLATRLMARSEENMNGAFRDATR